ncbi:hypothetical protein R1flu_021508 [Riccia fluitans]|uniref:Uncharacterized protein n=1 Tax=Riccia fluitans TaxID=41844 RepID=A0ABD1ZPW9_9MARC
MMMMGRAKAARLPKKNEVVLVAARDWVKNCRLRLLYPDQKILDSYMVATTRFDKVLPYCTRPAAVDALICVAIILLEIICSKLSSSVLGAEFRLWKLERGELSFLMGFFHYPHVADTKSSVLSVSHAAFLSLGAPSDGSEVMCL